MRTHGGNIYDIVQRYEISEGDILDFSANINPLGPSPAAVRAAKESLSIINRYPEPSMTGLRTAVSRYFGINPDNVICGNGSIELIYLIPRVFKPKRVLIPAPTFTEYAAAAESAGAEAVLFLLSEKDGYRLDPVETAFKLKGMDMAFLCNPNNPTGQLVSRAEMLEILKYAAQEGVRLVVDEAFMDFTGSDSLVREAVQSSHLICIRAFTKFFGMPGLRIGYGVADAETIEALRSNQEPWTVNIPAERAAIAALTSWGHIRKTRKLIERERERLISAFRLLPGVEPFPSAANFIFVKLATMDSLTLTEKLARRGILIRDCSSFPNLDNRYIRIAVKTKRENERLVSALKDVLLGR